METITREKIGIMGGTFDPIHNGHILMAEQVRVALGLNRVIFIPAGRPAFEEKSEASDPLHRYNMSLLATNNNKHFHLSDMEIVRSGVTYTVDTMREIKNARPYAEFYYIVGADAFERIDKWKDIDELGKYCIFAICARTGYKGSSELLSQSERLGLEARIVDTTNVDISSSDIRSRLAFGESVRHMVSGSVYNYILKNELYGGLLSAKYKLSLSLCEYRYKHSLSVMHEAISLGKEYGMDDISLKKLAAAALLHDCAKHFCVEHPFEEIVEYARQANITIDPFFAEFPSLSHSYVGMAIAKLEFGITDPDILSAIGNHTFGSVDMGLIDKIVYLADFFEPLRSKSGIRKKAKELAYKNIDKAMFFVLEYTLSKNLEKNVVPYPQTQLIMEYFRELGAENELE